MWRMKVLAVSVVVLGALLFGAVIAYAGWSWNAKVNVEGTVVSAAWTVAGDEDGALDYKARITVTVPDDADVSVVEVAPTEKVKVRHDGGLNCTEDGIEANVSYKVTHQGGGGGDVAVSVSTVEPQQELASASGSLGETISVDVVIPGSCSGS